MKNKRNLLQLRYLMTQGSVELWIITYTAFLHLHNYLSRFYPKTLLKLFYTRISNNYIHTKAVTWWSLFAMRAIWKDLDCFLVHSMFVNYCNVLYCHPLGHVFSMSKH